MLNDNSLDTVSDYHDSVGTGPAHVQEQISGPRHRRLQKKLKYFFMNPCDKYRVRKRFPWKMAMQLVKIVLVTIQLAMFGFSRSSHVDFLEKSNVAFKHLFLENWNPSFETLPYPPATGIYAIYTIPRFYEHVNYAMEMYNATEKVAIGTYHFSRPDHEKPPMGMCKVYYTKGKIDASNQTYEYDARHITDCFSIGPVKDCSPSGNCTLKYDIESFLHQHNKTLYFDRIITISLNFTLKTVHLKELSRMSSPDCYRFDIQILFDNTEHNGQMAINLYSKDNPLECNGRIFYDAGGEEIVQVLSVLLDVVVAVVSIMSLGLCVRSIYRALILKQETVKVFREMDQELSPYDKLEFLNMWYILIILNDILTVAGSMLKISIETRYNHNYEACGVMLGSGNLLVWFGVLRYLGFFEKYNILILTMKKSAPSVLRFLVCAGVFYFGFAVCGWVVLGPYHLKFRDLSTASECLFSLVNGDDMFVTFSIIGDDKPAYIWWFSRAYLYIFVSLFIYVVLNLFVAVILDTYEILKDYYKHGFPKSTLHEFADLCADYDDLRGDDRRLAASCCLPACCIPEVHRDDDEPSERTSLLS